MKKLFLRASTLLCLLLFLSSNALAFYSDVPESHKYYDEIKALYDNRQLPDESIFRPDEILVRTDLFKFIISYSQTPLANTAKLPYTDTNNNASYARYLQTALDLKILNPYTQARDFDINRKVTKYNALTNLFKGLGIGTNYFYNQNNFPFIDTKPESFIAQTAYKAYELGIIEENRPKDFRMAKLVTRGETAHYLYQISQYVPSVEVTVEIPNNLSSSDNSFDNTQKELINNKNFEIMLDVWSALKKNYFYQEDIDDEKLILGAIEGMVNQLSDAHTSFETPKDAAILLDQLSNTFQGIGTIIEGVENQIIIVSPLKESPAEKAGLKANDIIVGVDDEDITGQTINEVVSKIKGPEDTTVKIKVLRNNQELSFTVTRSFILKKTVFEDVLEKDGKKIGYLSLINFSLETDTEMIESANSLIEQGVDGLIIDLRNNPGGYLDIAVNIIGLFTKEDRTAVKLLHPDGEITELSTTGIGTLADLKTVVIVNEGSASASEIMAGALQDYGIAKIIGSTSYGKGSVQELKQYFNNSLFKYTTAKWLTPDGHEIDKKGVIPDKFIKNSEDPDQDKQLNAALAEF